MRKRKVDPEEDANPDRWIVSYADFITLMFAFFTVMYATSTNDFEKQKSFENSVKKALFKVTAVIQGAGEGDHLAAGEETTIIPPPIEVFRKRTSSPEEMNDALKRWVSEKLSDDERKTLGVEVRADASGVRLSLDSAMVFDSGSSRMRSESMTALSKVAEILSESGRGLVVEGHTDNIPISTQVYPSNWELAAARASTMVRYLIRVHQIEGKKMSAVSYADQKPIAQNLSEAGRKRNRRIEFLLTL